MKNMRERNAKLATFFLVLVVFGILIFYNMSSMIPNQTNQSAESSQTKAPAPIRMPGGSAAIFVPAVDSENKGILGKFEVQVLPGNGKTLTNIEHLLYFVDTQFSIQTAKLVAANITGADISKYNMIFDIDLGINDTRVIEGPSAGAALTIATIAAIENKTVRPDVMITGTINLDGTIGKVGKVAEKAKAAKAGGAKIFLVPQGEGLRQNFEVETSCEQTGNIRVCRTEYKPTQAASSDENGLIVREVSNIQDALKYFLQ